MKPQEAFSHRLRKLRQDNRVSQKELAKVLNLSDVSISRYELGSAEPSLETFHKICDYFDATPDYLLGNVDNPSHTVDRISLEELEERHKQNAETARRILPLSELVVDVLDGKKVQESNFSTVIRLLTILNSDELAVVGDLATFMSNSPEHQNKEGVTDENN